MRIALHIFFVLVYFCSLFSFKVLHFHEHNHNHDYSQLSDCDKNIYYVTKNINCFHDLHFKTLEEDCFGCDKHTNSPHLNNIYFLHSIVNNTLFTFNEINTSLVSKNLLLKQNKSPPLFFA